MSDCSNPHLKPYKRVEIRVVFTDRHELEYMLPLNLMNRTIDHIEVDSTRYVRQRNHEESWEWMNG